MTCASGSIRTDKDRLIIQALSHHFREESVPSLSPAAPCPLTAITYAVLNHMPPSLSPVLSQVNEANWPLLFRLNGSVRRRVSILLTFPLLLLCPHITKDPSKRLALSPTFITFLRRNLLCSLNWTNAIRVCMGQFGHMNLLLRWVLHEIWMQIR